MLTWTSDSYTGAPQISVKFDRYDSYEGRASYKWIVELDSRYPEREGYYFTGDDLKLGAETEASDIKALEALSSFLSAWVEAMEYLDGENADLFPREMWEAYSDGWHEMVDELTMEVGKGA